MTTVSVVTQELRVLVVDDNVDHRVLIGRRLREHGHSVVGAGTAADARATLAEDHVDVVLLDYRLPDVSGLDLLTELHDPAGPAIVLVTGMGSESVAVEALRAGATDYLAKDQRYLEELPLVVERAWQHHDHARRTAQLQRLALLVHSAWDRSDVLADIVKGARMLLRARTCVLLILAADGLEIVARSGDDIDDEDDLAATARHELQDGSTTSRWDDAERLHVPLPATHGDPVGTLVVVPTRSLSPEDLTLAETFASFAGTAIANSNRLEIERELVTHLQHVIDTRRDFLAAVSHELRTPLTCIQGFASTLAQRGEQLDAEERQQFAELIGQHSDELHELVEDLLEVATLQTGRAVTELGSRDLSAEIHAALEAVRPLLGDRPVDLDVTPVTVVADTRLLRRCLANLLSNAVKYSTAGTPISIRTVAEGASARVDVSDQGDGLTEQELTQVFQPFWRSKSAIRAATRGTGVGLALVSEYVRAMGGQVSASSVQGEGSTFSFTVPLASGRTRDE